MIGQIRDALGAHDVGDCLCRVSTVQLNPLLVHTPLFSMRVSTQISADVFLGKGCPKQILLRCVQVKKAVVAQSKARQLQIEVLPGLRTCGRVHVCELVSLSASGCNQRGVQVQKIQPAAPAADVGPRRQIRIGFELRCGIDPKRLDELAVGTVGFHSPAQIILRHRPFCVRLAGGPRASEHGNSRLLTHAPCLVSGEALRHIRLVSHIVIAGDDEDVLCAIQVHCHDKFIQELERFAISRCIVVVEIPRDDQQLGALWKPCDCFSGFVFHHFSHIAVCGIHCKMQI